MRTRDTQVLVLAGSSDFFSNGIHLHDVEASAHDTGDSAADASWRNIQAIDDVVLEHPDDDRPPHRGALRGNAGAGGCFLALACDRVWAHEGVVLNPHYKNMGNLYGSEYWTYTLPRRVGPARRRSDAAGDAGAPADGGAARRASLGLVDAVLADDAASISTRGPPTEAAALAARTITPPASPPSSASDARATRRASPWPPTAPTNCRRCTATSTASTPATTWRGTTS